MYVVKHTDAGQMAIHGKQPNMHTRWNCIVSAITLAGMNPGNILEYRMKAYTQIHHSNG